MADEALDDGRLLSSLRVTDLKIELSRRGLVQSGKKLDLLERLSKALRASRNEKLQATEQVSQTSEQAIEDDVEINESRDAVAMEQPVEEGVSSTELDQVQVQQSNERDIAGDAEEEEEEEKLDYDAADSMIVSTSVEDGEGDDILAELGTAGQPAHAKAKSSQVAEPEPRPEDIVPVPANTATPSQGRLSLRRSRDADSFSGDAVNRKRRWGSTSSGVDTSKQIDETDAATLPVQVNIDVAPPHQSSSHRVVTSVPVEGPVVSKHVDTDGHGPRTVSSGRHRMEQEIALQEEAEQQRLRELRLQDAMKRERLLKGTSEQASAASVQRSASGSLDGRHSSAAPGVSRSIATGGLAGQEPIPCSGSQTPPRQAACCTLSVHGLVRPFTLPQLKQLLSRYGPLVEGGFWIDRIKSHCYVSFEEESSAAACRGALHGARWPPTSPRCLSVDFANPTLCSAETNGQMSVRQSDGSSSAVTSSTVSTSAVERSTDTSGRHDDRQRADRRDDRAKKDDRERAHDRLKVDRERETRQTASPRRSRDQASPPMGSRSRPHVIEHEEEAPAASNVLDQLFRKTKTLPALYWLPLTDEQVAAKVQAEKSRKGNATSSPRRSPVRRRSLSRSRSPRSRYR